MKKTFKCEATGEEIVITTQRTSGFSYENIINMTTPNITAILSYANENAVRDAIKFLAKERKERFISLAKLFHGRMYENMRKY
jgi:hypothetical protein